MKRFVGEIFACIVLLAAAAGFAAEEKLLETPYYPLRVGTVWHYKVGDDTFTIRVRAHEKVGPTLCARLEVTRGGKVVGTQHLAVTNDGVYCHALSYRSIQPDPASGKIVEREVTRTPKPPTLVLKLPPKKGESWKVDSKTDGKPFRGVFRIDEREITVPAGTYKALRVTSQDLEANGLKPVLTTYYVRGIGMVKQVIQENKATMEIELVKFEPAK